MGTLISLSPNNVSQIRLKGDKMFKIISNINLMLAHWDSSNPKLVHNTEVLAYMNTNYNPLLGPNWNMNFLETHQLLVGGPFSSRWGREDKEGVSPIHGSCVLNINMKS